MSSAPQHSHTYSILDAAHIFGEIETAQKLQNNFLSLYMGQSEESLNSVAPYLFACPPNSGFGKWLLENGWGNSWGIFVETHLTIEELQKHFRKFLLVKTEDNKELYFRFYDPRVLRIFLPTCDEQQLKEFFGQVKMFGMESEDAEFALKFELENGKLISKKVTKQNFWNKLNGITGADISENNINSKTENQPAQNKANPNKKWNFLID